MTSLFHRKNLSVNSKSLKFRALGILISVLWPLLLSKLHSKAKKPKANLKVRVKIKPHACKRYRTWKNTFKESTNQVYSLKIQNLMKESAILAKSFQSTKQFKNPTKKPLTSKTRMTRKKTCLISRKTFIFILIKPIDHSIQTKTMILPSNSSNRTNLSYLSISYSLKIICNKLL